MANTIDRDTENAITLARARYVKWCVVSRESGQSSRPETNVSIDNIARISAALGVSAAVLMVEE